APVGVDRSDGAAEPLRISPLFDLLGFEDAGLEARDDADGLRVGGRPRRYAGVSPPDLHRGFAAGDLERNDSSSHAPTRRSSAKREHIEPADPAHLAKGTVDHSGESPEHHCGDPRPTGSATRGTGQGPSRRCSWQSPRQNGYGPVWTWSDRSTHATSADRGYAKAKANSYSCWRPGRSREADSPGQAGISS